jgi:TolA-binding protein
VGRRGHCDRCGQTLAILRHGKLACVQDSVSRQQVAASFPNRPVASELANVHRQGRELLRQQQTAKSVPVDRNDRKTRRRIRLTRTEQLGIVGLILIWTGVVFALRYVSDDVMPGKAAAGSQQAFAQQQDPETATAGVDDPTASSVTMPPTPAEIPTVEHLLQLCHQGRYEEAVHGFDALIERSPEDGRLYEYRGRALYFLDRFKDAHQDYEQALINGHVTHDVYFHLGNTLAAMGSHIDAVHAYKRALNIEQRAAACCNLGVSYDALGLLEDSMQSYRDALAIDPDHALSRYNLEILTQNHSQTQPAVSRPSQ